MLSYGHILVNLVVVKDLHEDDYVDHQEGTVASEVAELYLEIAEKVLSILFVPKIIFLLLELLLENGVILHDEGYQEKYDPSECKGKEVRYLEE